MESFHGRLREECLRLNWFTDMFDARRKGLAWKNEYNNKWPHTELWEGRKLRQLENRPGVNNLCFVEPIRNCDRIRFTE